MVHLTVHRLNVSKPSKVDQVESRVCRGVVMAQKAVVVGVVVLKELKPVSNQLKV